MCRILKGKLSKHVLEAKLKDSVLFLKILDEVTERIKGQKGILVADDQQLALKKEYVRNGHYFLVTYLTDNQF